MAGGELVDFTEAGAGELGWDAEQIAGELAGVELGGDAGAGSDGTRRGGEEDGVGSAAEVERALAGVVTGQEELLVSRIPDGQGEGAGKVVKAGGAPAEPGAGKEGGVGKVGELG